MNKENINPQRIKKSLKVVKGGKEMRKAPSEKFITSAKYKLSMGPGLDGKEKLKIKFKRPDSAASLALTTNGERACVGSGGMNRSKERNHSKSINRDMIKVAHISSSLKDLKAPILKKSFIKPSTEEKQIAKQISNYYWSQHHGLKS